MSIAKTQIYAYLINTTYYLQNVNRNHEIRTLSMFLFDITILDCINPQIIAFAGRYSRHDTVVVFWWILFNEFNQAVDTI